MVLPCHYMYKERSMMINYFLDIVRYDPVNHLLILHQKDLELLKLNISSADICHISSQLEYLLDEPIYHVLQKDKTLFPDFDTHDYVSLATYFHPNPHTKDGLPYIRKDGIPNHENDLLDKKGLRYTGYILYHHLLLYFLTDEKRYYESIKKRIYTYFINPDTAMNPNMNHGQMIKGVHLGRGIGIIDFASSHTYVLVLFKSLYDMGYIEDAFYFDFKKWISAFCYWLKYSDIGIEEKNAKNNHGTMYDLLLLVLYDFLDEFDESKALIDAFIVQRVDVQFDQHGAMPKELERTKSKSYALMAFKAMNDFIKMTSKFKGSQLYVKDSYDVKIKHTMELGFDYLIDRLILRQKDWRHQQIQIFDEATLLPLIWYAKNQLQDTRDLVQSIDEKNIGNDILFVIIRALLR